MSAAGTAAALVRLSVPLGTAGQLGEIAAAGRWYFGASVQPARARTNRTMMG